MPRTLTDDQIKKLIADGKMVKWETKLPEKPKADPTLEVLKELVKTLKEMRMDPMINVPSPRIDVKAPTVRVTMPKPDAYTPTAPRGWTIKAEKIDNTWTLEARKIDD